MTGTLSASRPPVSTLIPCVLAVSRAAGHRECIPAILDFSHQSISRISRCSCPCRFRCSLPGASTNLRRASGSPSSSPCSASSASVRPIAIAFVCSGPRAYLMPQGGGVWTCVSTATLLAARVPLRADPTARPNRPRSKSSASSHSSRRCTPRRSSGSSRAASPMCSSPPASSSPSCVPLSTHARPLC